MADKKTITPLERLGLSEKDLVKLSAAWLSCHAADNIDFEQYAVLAGYTSVSNARKRFGELKRKVRQQVFGGDGTAPGPSSSSASANKAGKAAGTEANRSAKRKTNGHAGEDGSPTKKTKARGLQVKNEDVDGDGDVEDNEGSAVVKDEEGFVPED
ncbi:hypothetical protein SPI_01960 [Niveomyces insectorum RCEF 264]|uniref:Uncharacterized protein n=1 Tax=Niveomyces insectorum RCEF 264 TaxID=1081102 RepID=A0A167XMW0_9HYPO|nr:hypothetical protein SPI_01960 [Niveomyces insectorum RCEF 264]